MTVDDLLAAGRHADAAAAARAAGDPARAARIYAQIWDFRQAAACALEAGDRVAAIGHLCDAGDAAAAEGLAREVAAGGGEPARAAAAALAGRRLYEPAAAIYERAGDDAKAAELYARGGSPVEAARLYEKIGRLHDAGRLLERVTAGDAAVSDEARARAELGLGRILARLGQHDEAALHLQQAARAPATRGEALALLVPELAALGLPEAAAELLAEARSADSALPATVAEAAGRLLPAPTEGTVTIAGRYRPLRALGGGAAGRVYLMRDEVTGLEVAVKMLTAPAGPGPSPSYERFVREAHVWQRANHHNIVKMLDFREDLGYMAMELMAGGTLADRIAAGPLPPPLVKRLAIDVLAALAHAHERGVIHRDVKPQNIFLDAHGLAKLGDFGVAHLLDLGQTQTGALIGTLAYMAPEQITGAPLGAGADLYAVGVTLFQALTGRLPFLGPDFIAQHLGDAPPRASEIAPAAGPWDHLLALLLAKDPAERPASAVEVAEQVRAIDGGARAGALSLPRPGPAAVEPAPAAPAPVEPDGLRRGEGSRYTAEIPIGATACSTLARAVDQVLDRTVVIERFAPGHPDAATEARLYKLAAAPTPYVQRVLAYDRAAGVVVFEAPVGAPPAEVRGRVLGELGAALAALHELGATHGALAGHVLFDEDAGVTLLAAGLGPAAEDASPAADVAAALALAGLPPDAAHTAAGLIALSRSW